MAEVTITDIRDETTLSTRPETMLGLTWKYFVKHKLALAGAIVLIFMVIGYPGRIKRLLTGCFRCHHPQPIRNQALFRPKKSTQESS